MRKDVVEFIKAAIARPLEVSTIFPTSPALAERLLRPWEPTSDGAILELGPGTGAITKFIAPQLKDPSLYMGIEINVDMVEFLRAEYPNLRFERAAAEQLTEFVAKDTVSTVASSLPWTVFPVDMQARTLDAIHAALKPGGVFLTYMCVNASWYPQARHFQNLLRERFARVDKSPIEWRNIPPAFVLQSIKG